VGNRVGKLARPQARVRPHPQAGQAGGSLRVKQVVRKNIWDQKTALNFYLLLRAIGPVPTGR
jgi:hypothetical protein